MICYKLIAVHFLHEIGPEWIPFLTCEDFVQCIKETLKPARGRELFAEKLEGLWDWQKFMEPMERVMSGVAILKSQPDVNYAFRIVTRKDMKLYSGYEKWVDMADEEHEV